MQERHLEKVSRVVSKSAHQLRGGNGHQPFRTERRQLRARPLLLTSVDCQIDARLRHVKWFAAAMDE